MPQQMMICSKALSAEQWVQFFQPLTGNGDRRRLHKSEKILEWDDLQKSEKFLSGTISKKVKNS
jgi:hypothetical protein